MSNVTIVVLGGSNPRRIWEQRHWPKERVRVPGYNDSMQPDDLELLTRWADGDQQGGKMFAERYVERLRRYFHTIDSDRTTIETMIVDTLGRCQRSREWPEESSEVPAFVMGVATQIAHDTQSDYGLLRRWVEGEEEAGGRFVARIIPPLYRFFRNKMGDEWEDRVHETIVRVRESWNKVKAPEKLQCFVLGVANNVLREAYRQRDKRQREIDWNDLERWGSACMSHALLGERVTADIARREEHQLLLAGLRRIELLYQLILELHYFEGMTTKGIAQCMGRPDGTIRRWLQEGRAKLETALHRMEVAASIRSRTHESLAFYGGSLRDIDHEELCTRARAVLVRRRDASPATPGCRTKEP